MEEPDALVAHVRICAGGASTWAGGPTAIQVGEKLGRRAGHPSGENSKEAEKLDTHQEGNEKAKSLTPIR